MTASAANYYLQGAIGHNVCAMGTELRVDFLFETRGHSGGWCLACPPTHQKIKPPSSNKLLNYTLHLQ
jgi:hypothetical protein